MKIIRQELQFEECLKQRIEFICKFSKITPTFVNGSIRKLERVNKHNLTDYDRVTNIINTNNLNNSF